MKHAEDKFVSVSRAEFRKVFQPSRIVFAILPDPQWEVNVITICFNMHTSYQPNMVAFAIHRKAHSNLLAASASECVLSVPGESLASEAMFCGTHSGKTVNKFKSCGFVASQSESVNLPGLANAIANIEVKILKSVVAGDHSLIIGEAVRFKIDPSTKERSLLSIGPDTRGFDLLLRHGKHRIGVIRRGDT
jgi:flavin reductase (DIM6/NTAB) family NADH-FMN oxidoreductase RutF